MLNPSINPRTKDAKDALERLDNWVNVLEKRIYALLDTNDPESMTPAEREQAASRHLMILRHFFQLRQEYVALSDDSDDPATIHALVHGDYDEDDFDMESSY